MKKITIAGIGMGNPDTLTVKAARCIKEAEVLIGHRRMLEIADGQEQVVYASYDSDEILAFIENTEYERYAVLMSGDTGFFSGTDALLEKLKAYDITVLPGISSIAYFAAAIKMPWQDANVVSLHGRNADIVREVMTHHKTFVLTGGNVSEICSRLCAAGLGNCTVYAGERLSYEDERILCKKANELIGLTFQSISVLFIINDFASQFLSVGIPDQAFFRGKVPMTKSEVRSVILGKLQLSTEQTVYDIGAGTGSVSVELASVLTGGLVYAVETKEEAVLLIESNKEKFHLNNIEVIHGTAPEVLSALPVPNAAFIGGSGGRLKETMQQLLEKNKKIRVVITAIALETVAEALEICKEMKLTNLEIVQLTVSRAARAGNYHMMTGQNPIFVISAGGNQDEDRITACAAGGD